MDPAGEVNLYFLLFIGTGGMFLLACASIFLFVSYHRRNARAQAEKFRMEKEHQEALIHSNLKTLEDERQRFARDVHDEVGVNLSTVSMQLKGLNQVSDPAHREQRMTEINGVIEHAIQSTRRIAHNLIPPGLEKFGLPPILEEQLAPVLKGTGLQLNLQCDEPLTRPEFEKELVLYRIIQELLNNTIKHAGATQVRIHIGNHSGHYQVQYHDNGKGFDPKSNPGHGLGLRNLESRVKMIGGSYQFESATGAGVHCTISVTN